MILVSNVLPTIASLHPIGVVFGSMALQRTQEEVSTGVVARAPMIGGRSLEILLIAAAGLVVSPGDVDLYSVVGGGGLFDVAEVVFGADDASVVAEAG